MQVEHPEHMKQLRNRFEKLIRLIRKNKEIRDYSRIRKAYDLLCSDEK